MIARDQEDIDLATGLVRLSHLVQGVFARVSDRHDLTPAQARILCILAERPKGMAELAGLLGVEKAGLTGLVDRVEHRSLVERRAVPGDRRAWQVTLTGIGRQAAVTVHDEVCAELGEIVGELPPGEPERLRRILARVITTHGAPPIFPAIAQRA